METYFSLTNLPETMPMDEMAHTYETFDTSVPGNQAFLSGAPCQVPPSASQAQVTDTLYMQYPWWKTTSPPCSEYPSNEILPYSDHLSPWDSGLSSISDPQSPSSCAGSMPSANYYESTPIPYEDPVVFDAAPIMYPIPEGLRDMGSSLALPEQPMIENQSECHSSFTEIPIWPINLSEHNTIETNQPTPLQESMPPVLQSRPRVSSRARNPTERRTGSALGRRRRRAVPLSKDEAVLRTFACSFAPYGCTSTFVSKNEWKRHVTSKHLLLGFYRCDVGKCKTPMHKLNNQSASPCKSVKFPSTPQLGQPNDFNRKDLFTQHQRRMHAPWLQSGRRKVPTDNERHNFESGLEEIRQRCWQSLRQPPTQSHCGFCKQTFAGIGSWDVRMEHVGRHFEREEPENLGEEEEDVALREWGLKEGILTFVDGRCLLASLGL